MGLGLCTLQIITVATFIPLEVLYSEQESDSSKCCHQSSRTESGFQHVLIFDCEYMQVWRWQWCFREVERGCSWREDERDHGRLISSHEEPEPGIHKKHLRVKACSSAWGTPEEFQGIMVPSVHSLGALTE